MFTTKTGWVQNPIGNLGFGFIHAMHGEDEITIFVRQERLFEAGWQSKDFSVDLQVEVEYKQLKDGRYVATKFHQIDHRLAPNFYNLTVVDRDKERGLSIVKVFDVSVSYATGFRVLNQEGQSQGSYPTLVAARASIGRVIAPPRDINHGVKTNMVTALPKEKEKKKKAA